MNSGKRVLAGMLASTMLISTLAGCSGSSVLREDVTKYSLPAALTKSEVQEYYAKSLEFDSIVTKNLEIDLTKYEEREVSPDSAAWKKVTAATAETLSILGRMNYEVSDKNTRYCNENLFHYIKSYLNDKKLNYQVNNTKITSALGFYFVDLEFDVSAAQIGEFTGESSLLGINGAFRKVGKDQIDEIDKNYLNSAIKKLNEYYADNRINKTATFNTVTNLFSTSRDVTGTDLVDFTQTTAKDNGDTALIGNENNTDTTIDNPEAPLAAPEGAVDPNAVDPNAVDPNAVDPNAVDPNAVDPNYEGEQGVDPAEPNESETNPDEDPNSPDESDYTPADDMTDDETVDNNLNIRSPGINITEFHSVVGSNTRMSAYMPKLDMVYKIPGVETETIEGKNEQGETVQKNVAYIAGMGIFPSGIGGLKNFNFKRDLMKGTIQLRIVYKEDLEFVGELICTNIYPRKCEMTSGISSNDTDIIADFMVDKFDDIIDRADRSIMNCDMTALMNGKVFADMGMAVLRGYESNYVNLIRQISTPRRVVKRDIGANLYLVEVETLRQEGAKGANAYGTYLDTAYVAIQQNGTEFTITDWFTYSRILQAEPDIDPDNVILKRLIAFDTSSTEEIPEETKKAAEQLVNDLYVASTYRISTGSTVLKTANGEVEIRQGMNDCFNPNNEMLSSSKRTSLISKLQSRLIKYGQNVKANMTGQIYEFVGGTDKQIEFFTEEFIRYVGRDEGYYTKNYYLISCMEDKWVIDDIKCIEEHEVKDTEFLSLSQRFGI